MKMVNCHALRDPRLSYLVNTTSPSKFCMYTRLLNHWENFRSSFWFVPAILMISAAVGAYLMVTLDGKIDKDIVKAFPIFEMSPPAARSILSSIVGAMISATGVVFSMTIVALSLASSQFGSRLIRTYRGRRSTHFTLGIFVSTSLYCILVLSCIREIKEYVFVPTLSVGLGIVLTVVCLSTLIYYIHDMSYAIQASSVIDKSAEALDAAMQRLFPTKLGQPVDPEEDEGQIPDESMGDRCEENLGDRIWTTKCDRVGYVQAIENESVMSLASEHKLVIRLLLQPGDFIHPGSLLADIHQAADRESLEDLDQEAVNLKLADSLIVGGNRTPTQDIRYAFNELVEVAVRALSPGINDPFTAINCVDRISAALHELKSCKIPSAYRVDEDKVLRVIAEPVQFETCLQNSLGVIEHYAKDNPMVKERVASALSAIEQTR